MPNPAGRGGEGAGKGRTPGHQEQRRQEPGGRRVADVTRYPSLPKSGKPSTTRLGCPYLGKGSLVVERLPSRAFRRKDSQILLDGLRAHRWVNVAKITHPFQFLRHLRVKPRKRGLPNRLLHGPPIIARNGFTPNIHALANFTRLPICPYGHPDWPLEDAPHGLERITHLIEYLEKIDLVSRRDDLGIAVFPSHQVQLHWVLA